MIRARDCDKILEATDKTSRELARLRTALSKFDMVVFMGMPSSGKTTTLQRIGFNTSDFNVPNHLYWNRADQYKILFGNYEIDHSYNPIIQNYEFAVIDKLFKDSVNGTERRILVYEGWLLAPRLRSMLLKRAKDNGLKSLCMVFDGPDSGILERLDEKNGFSTMNGYLLDESRQKVSWPTRREGWNSIVYVNTFGDAGLEYLDQYL